MCKILAARELELKNATVCFYEAVLLPTATPKHISWGVIEIEECCPHDFTPLFHVFKKAFSKN